MRNLRTILIVWGALGIILSLALNLFLDWVPLLGRNIPQDDLVKDFLIGVLWAVILGVSLLVFPIPSRDKGPLLVIWIAKTLVAFSVMLFYEYKYLLDAFWVFEAYRHTEFLEAYFNYVTLSNASIYRLSLAYHEIFPSYFHAMKISFAFLGLFGVYFYYRGVVLLLNREWKPALYLIGFVPSILFWSTTLGKDPVLFFASSMVFYGMAGLLGGRNPAFVLLVLFGFAVNMFFRPWLGLLIIASLIPLTFIYIKEYLPKIAFTILTIGVCTAIWNSSMGNVFIQVKTPEDILRTLNWISRSWRPEYIGLESTVQFSNFKQAFLYIPQGIFSALFRPFPGEIGHMFGLLAGIENIVLLAFFGLALKRASWSQFKNPMIIWSILLIIGWAAAYGFVSYHNVGAVSRFKIQFLPVLLGLMLYCILGRGSSPSPRSNLS